MFLIKGVATQDPGLNKGLDPADKEIRVPGFHAGNIEATREIMEACGFKDLEDIQPSKFFHRINEQVSRSYEQIYFSRKDQLKNKMYSSLN